MMWAAIGMSLHVWRTLPSLLLCISALAHGAVTIHPTTTHLLGSDKYVVDVRAAGTEAWTRVPVHRTLVRHERFGGPFAAAASWFDFSGIIDVRVVRRAATPAARCLVRPAWMAKNLQHDGNTVIFKLEQDPTFPRAVSVEFDGDLQTNLHLVTKPPEQAAADVADPRFCVVEPGASVPLPLPAGKTAYYFKAGVHALPGFAIGPWVEVDLGSVLHIDRFLMQEGGKRDHHVLIEAKLERDDAYRVVASKTEAQAASELPRSCKPFTARFLRYRIIGSRAGRKAIRECAVFPVGSDAAVHGAWLAGCNAQTKRMVDGNAKTLVRWGNAYQSFFLPQHTEEVYLAGGAVLQAGIRLEGLDGIRIHGRGFIDGTTLNHKGQTKRSLALNAIHCTKVELSGINVLDMPKWNINFDNCKQVRVRNCSVIGRSENDDGLHFSASADCQARGLFIRCSDDVMGVYSKTWSEPNLHIHDILFENSVVWNDKAHCFYIFPATRDTGIIERVTWRNMDVLGAHGSSRYDGICAIKDCWSKGRAKGVIRDITFEDIRVSHIEASRMINILGHPTVRVERVRFIGLRYDEAYPAKANERASQVRAANAMAPVTGVSVSDYRRSGKLVRSRDEARLKIGNHVRGVSITGE